MKKSTYFNHTGLPHLVDDSAYVGQISMAQASCLVKLTKEAFDWIACGIRPNSDVLSIAALGGVCGAKEASVICPLISDCQVVFANLDYEIDQQRSAIKMLMTVKGIGGHGVEARALVAVLSAAATICDAVREIDPRAKIEEAFVVEVQSYKEETLSQLPANNLLAEAELKGRHLKIVVPSIKAKGQKSKAKRKPKRKAPAKRKAGPKAKAKTKRKPKSLVKVIRKVLTKARVKPRTKTKGR